MDPEKEKPKQETSKNLDTGEDTVEVNTGNIASELNSNVSIAKE